MADTTQALKQAGQAAQNAAVDAITAAAENAAKNGMSTSEFKVTVGAVAVTALLAGLHALSVIPGPWMVPAILGSALVSCGYAISRGTVKSTALKAAATSTAGTPAVRVQVGDTPDAPNGG